MHTQDETVIQPLDRAIRGIAPQCRLLSLKVLDANGRGKSSAVIEAIAAVQKLNDFGRRIVVHGVNLSLGYPFMAEWFACGQSPLCAEVNRLVKSGVVAVVAAGNSGYGSIGALSGSITAAGLPLTITIRATPKTPSRWAPRTATCRTPTAFPISPRRDRPATAA